MSNTITLATIRGNVRFRADMVSSLFCTDVEINGYIQSSYRELYDLLVEAVEDYNLLNLADSTVLITSGNTFNLPTNFYKLRGVDDLSDSSNPRTVRKFMFGERNDYISYGGIPVGTEYSDVLYRIVGSTIEILPSDRAQRQFGIWYVPTPTVPVSDSDSIDVINGFDEYITVDAAIKCLIKEESDVTILTKQKAALTDRIYRMRANRDQNLPEKVTRVRNRRGNRLFGSYIGQRDF